jgi:hypothetical protein
MQARRAFRVFINHVGSDVNLWQIITYVHNRNLFLPALRLQIIVVYLHTFRLVLLTMDQVKFKLRVK